ncbi:LANO_0H04984g1_1 [Lachancea nothofagi CBS 11611]|uniref:LANO_0H04984g1_1 n=1 Tax=Lachancea nothofagi CBS 11611 TaxID=1266666 RepID=A0A1G4KLP6_9SACH|nr:LANO_0H04984g1_1 [Lachancea nothofagi CBS 11611]
MNSHATHNHGSISSRTTQTSSVFSAEEDDYDARIKEIEAYYIRTLLDEELPALPHEYSKQRQAPPAVAAVNTYDLEKLRLAFASSQQQLEVEINPHYMPATGVLPLTSENLKLLQNPKLAPQRPECLAPAPEPTPSASAPVNSNTTSTNTSQQNEGHEKCNKVLYKTELCESFSTKGLCKYGPNCQFAHGLQELKFKERNNKFRTKPCANWMRTGSCPYGQRCCFKHGNDSDIKVYLRAGHNQENMSRRNHHANVQVLQRMAW